MKGREGLPALTQGAAWGTSGDHLLQGLTVSRPAPRPRSLGNRGVRAPVRKHLSPHVSGNPTQPQRVGATQPRRVGDHGFSKHIPDARAVSLGGHECFSSSPPAPCVTFAKAGPGRGQGPLMAASLQVPSSSPTSLPWPSRASRCSTLSSPLASACAGAASGCGRPSRPTWVAWVRGPRAPRLQLLCGVGAGLCLRVRRVFAGCSLVTPVHARRFGTEGAGVPGTQVPKAGIKCDSRARGPPQSSSLLAHGAQSVHAGP